LKLGPTKRFILAIIFFFNSSAFAQWVESDYQNKVDGKKRLSIVYAGQNIKSPISMFGHVYLVFHDERVPEPNAITFEFTGSINGVGDYLGTLFGTTKGFYKFSLLDYKKRDHDLENRSSWVYEVAFTDDELTTFKKNIAVLSSNEYHYSVFNLNCASYLIEQIRSIRGQEYQQESIFFVSPDSTIRWLHKKQMIGTPLFIPSSQVKALGYFNKLNGEDQSKVMQAFAGVSITDPPSSDNFSKALSASADYLMARDDNFSSRVNVFNIKKNHPLSDENAVKFYDPAEIDGSATYSALLSNQGLIFKFRPGFLDFENESFYGLRNSSTEFLGLSILLNTKRLELEKFTLFRAEAYVPDEFLYDSGSQLFDISFTNFRSFYNQKNQETAITFAKGYTKAIQGQLFSVLPLVSLKKIDTESQNEAAPFLGFRARLYGDLPWNLAYRLNYDKFYSKFSDGAGVKSILDAEIFSTKALDVGVSLNYALVNSVSRIGLRFYKTF
jgi:hypothetical protein